MVGAGEGGGLAPGEMRAGCGLQFGEFRLGGERGEPAVGGDEAGCGAEGFFHAIYGAEGDALIGRGQGLGTGWVNAGGDASDADGFLEEGGLFVLGFGEGDGDRGAADGDGDAGETGTGAIVEEGGDAGGKGLGTGNGLEEVTFEDGVGLADSGEVGACVPADQKH